MMKPDGFEASFKPRGRFFDLCVQGRLLILSSGVNALHRTEKAPLTRETCLAMNAACIRIAENTDTSDLETQLDTLVTQLYNLTPEEIKIVEEKS